MVHTLSRRDFVHKARGVALATPFLSLLGCSEEEKNPFVSLRGETMGTTYSVKLADISQNTDTAKLGREIDGVLEAVNRQMSTYRPDSELSRFNAAGPDSWTAVSEDTLAVVEEALRISRLTGGAFDPTVGPLVDLWGFGPAAAPAQLPSSSEIATRAGSVGYAMVQTRAEPPALGKAKDATRLDLSGVAKGFGVDKVAEHLDRSGIGSYLVEVGGELRAGGVKPDRRHWRIGIEKPTARASDLQYVVELDQAALATSGDYRLFFERDGRRYSHIIDPTTGRPVAHPLASATVVARTTMAADALSTSLLVLGPEAGMRFATEHDIAAYLITRRGEGYTAEASPAFQQRFGA